MTTIHYVHPASNHLRNQVLRLRTVTRTYGTEGDTYYVTSDGHAVHQCFILDVCPDCANELADPEQGCDTCTDLQPGQSRPLTY